LWKISTSGRRARSAVCWEVLSSARSVEISVARAAVAAVSSVRSLAGIAMPAGGRRLAGGGGVWAWVVKVRGRVKRKVRVKVRVAGRRMGTEFFTADGTDETDKGRE
jgi:hypothetical protein